MKDNLQQVQELRNNIERLKNHAKLLIAEKRALSSRMTENEKRYLQREKELLHAITVEKRRIKRKVEQIERRDDTIRDLRRMAE